MKDATLEAAMWEALNTPLGVAVSTDNPGLFRQRFYKIRKKYPEMQCLSADLPMKGDPNEVWIVKTPENLDAQSEE